MNFLAHLHLSSPNELEMVGNFMGDYVKGKAYQNYPKDISRGLMLHRKIDSFTDHHPLQKACALPFRKDYGLYSGIIVDMLFDHFLAKYWDRYSTSNLDEFAQNTYALLARHFEYLPLRVQAFLPKMKAASRLQSYATLPGLENALRLMSHYTSLPDKTDKAMLIIDAHFEEMETHFFAFYEGLMAYVRVQRMEMVSEL